MVSWDGAVLELKHLLTINLSCQRARTDWSTVASYMYLRFLKSAPPRKYKRVPHRKAGIMYKYNTRQKGRWGVPGRGIIPSG